VKAFKSVSLETGCM